MSIFDEPYIKFFLLIIPAILTALGIVLSPIIEEKKFKNHIIGKTITILVYIYREGNKTEIYRTEGIIDLISDDKLVIKRKTQPSFRIPLKKQELLQQNGSDFTSQILSIHTINSEYDLDINRGLFNL